MPFFVHPVDGLFDRVRAAAHDDDDVFRVGRAHVVEEMIGPAGELGHLVHHFLYDRGRRVVIGVRGLAVLEVNVRILRGAALNGVLGVQRAGAEILDILHVDEGFHLVVVDDVDFRDFVAGAEPVEEVQEGHSGL